MDNLYCDCPRCGAFGLTYRAEAALPELLTTPRRMSVLSYAIRRTPPSGLKTTLFDHLECKRLVEADYLPTPQEQAENLVRWLGDNLAGPGETLRISFPGDGARLGAQSRASFHFIVKGLEASGLLEVQSAFIDGSSEVTLSFAGWERFEQLRRGTPTGRKAFMAMQYRNSILDRLVNDFFRTAVEETGFTLRRLDDDPRAGLIDDRLRVEIQSARFLIVDLTYKNAGAYWEAGYAEGLGKPVIYTCEESRFREDSHFDTNHHLHVLWKEDDAEAAAKLLKATIRATIPDARRE
jgi:hypothetical protein